MVQTDFPQTAPLKKLAGAIQSAKGRPVAVGGCVRDHLLGVNSKDIDVEVFGLALEELELTLKKIGEVYEVGRSFAVLKVKVDGQTFDVSLPRLENKTGQGHRGFIVHADPNLPFERASLRRDFTINAMGIDLGTGELLDPNDGKRDLENRILRHVSDQFDEDPLRVFRGAQFAARFELTAAPETIAKCQNLRDELATLPKERLYEEIKKLVLAKKPSFGLHFLRETKAISHFPELAGLIDCPQDPVWHPEGDVWVHTLMVTDQAAQIVRRENLVEDEAVIIVLGALCHDLGKPGTTKLEDGRIRSKNHEPAGEKPTRTLLALWGFPDAIAEAVVPLVRDHLKPAQLYRTKDEVSDGAIRRLASRVPLKRLCMVAEADFLGRTTEDALKGVDPSVLWLLDKAEGLCVKEEGPKAILQGRHLIDLGYKPGRQLGDILQKAFDAQLDGVFSDLESAIAWVKREKP